MEEKMKPEPLKDKIKNWIKDESFDGKAPIIRICDDIESAVEWLKERLRVFDIKTIKNMEILIDEAFEDVTKK